MFYRNYTPARPAITFKWPEEVHPPAAGSIEMKLELSCKDEKEVYDDFVLKKSTFTLDKKDFQDFAKDYIRLNRKCPDSVQYKTTAEVRYKFGGKTIADTVVLGPKKYPSRWNIKKWDAQHRIEMKVDLPAVRWPALDIKQLTFDVNKITDFKSLQEMEVREVATGGRAKSHTTCGVEDNKMIPAVYNEGKAIQECLPLTEESGLFGGKGVYRVNPRARIRIETTLGIGKPTEKFLTYPQTGSEVQEGKHNEYGELMDPPVAIPIHTYILESEMTVGISCTLKGDCDYSSDSPMDKKFLLVLEESVEDLNKKVAGMKDSLSEEFMKKYFKGDEFQVLQFIIDRAHYAPTTNGYTYKGVLTFTQPVEAYGKEDLYGTKGIPIVKGARFPLNIDTGGDHRVTADWFYPTSGGTNGAFDIASNGEPVVSICDGTIHRVIDACPTNSGSTTILQKKTDKEGNVVAWGKCGGKMGNAVIVTCSSKIDKKTIKVRYLHFQQGVPVEDGQKVQVGDTLGTSDHTGYSSGGHLHIDAELGGVRIPLNCVNWDEEVFDETCEDATTKPGKR